MPGFCFLMRLSITEWQNACALCVNEFFDRQLVFQYLKMGQNYSFSLHFAPRNFAHLCGVKYTTGANNFVNDLMAHRLKQTNVIFDETPKQVLAKAEVITGLPNLLRPGVRVSEHGSFLKLHFDKAIRTNRNILALTLINAGNTYLIPNSLINLRMSKEDANAFMHNYPVKHIYTIDDHTGNQQLLF